MTEGSELGEYHFERGMCKLKEGDCRGCIADCDLSLQFSPNSQWCNKAIYHKAMAYEQLEKLVLLYFLNLLILFRHRR